MQIGIRAHDMEKANNIEELVENISKKGFSCAQLALGKAINNFKTDVNAMTPGLALYLKRIFQKNNVDIAVLGCYLNLGAPDEKLIEETKKVYKAHIRFASILGCAMVGTETGAVNNEYIFEERNKSEEALKIFINNFREIVECAEKMGVIIGIEPVANHIVYNMQRAKIVLEEINSPNLQIIFDPVNLITMDNYQEQNKMMIDAINLCGDDIAVLHLKDFIVQDNKIKHVIAGDGMLDYKLLMNWVRKDKPYIHALLEDTNPQNVLFARDFVLDEYDLIRK